MSLNPRNTKIGLIGLGNAGHYYAKNLLRASYSLMVHDLDEAKAEVLEPHGAKIAANVEDIAENCSFIVLSLPNPEAVKSVLIGDTALFSKAAKGTIVIDISTINPDTAAELFDVAKQHGIQYLECPMSGGEPGGAGQYGAEKASVTFLVGGEEPSLERARPILMSLGKHVLFLGPAGTASTIKLISNLIAGLNMAVMAEGFVLGAAAGISHDVLLNVFKNTDAKSYTMFEEFAPHFTANDYTGGFPVELQHKDHRLAAELGRKFGVPLLFNQIALEAYQIARSMGHGRDAHAVIVEVLAKLGNVTLTNK